MKVEAVKQWFTSFDPVLSKVREEVLPALIRYLIAVVIINATVYLFMGHDELP